MIAALRRNMGEHGDLVLVFCTIGILIVLFMPIPPGLLDFLLLTNLSFAMMILLLTFYMGKPLDFSTFPSLLLIATLFRLSLNISATRLILSNANAGHVIGAIGSYAVGGNYVIGMIVFLVLVVVQYVVVTNGAQRVAEVAARFTLDSMPGKQMSIDADLNMGLIDDQEARHRRKTVEKEANFYGAMDGASRFVKGDAIAGIIIILIDIIGGLSIGVGQHGMPWSEALHRYTLLTIGDGIVTQIPALVIATGTGIIVTRAATDAQLSDEVSKQITAYPKVLILIGMALSISLFLPGIPSFPVLILLSLVAGIFFLVRRAPKSAKEASDDAKRKSDAGDDLYSLLTVEPIELCIGQNMIPMVGGEDSVFMDRIKGFRKQYALEMGFVFPKLRVRDKKKLPPNSYEIKIYGTKVAEGESLSDRVLAINPGGKRAALEGIEVKDPTYGLPATWITEELSVNARELGYTVVDAATVLMTHVSEIIRQQAPNLLTRSETEGLVNRVRGRQSGLVDELIPSVLTLGDVQKVLQNLLREKVSIRHIDAILEVLADSGASNRDPEYLTDRVREKLGTAICQSLTNNQGELYVLTFDPSVEHMITNGVRAVDDKSMLVLEPNFAEKLLVKMSKEVERMMATNLYPVVLCSPTLRRHVRKFTERIMPHLSVLSLSEVPNSISLKSFGMITA